MPAIEPEYVDNMANSLDQLRNLKPKSDSSELHGVSGSEKIIQAPNGDMEIVSMPSSEKDAPANPWNTWNSGAKDKPGNKVYD